MEIDNRYALMFTTETCGACKIIKTYLKDIKDINVKEIMLSDETRDMFKENGVTSAPTLLFYKDDTLLSRKEGFVSQGKFMEEYFSN